MLNEKGLTGTAKDINFTLQDQARGRCRCGASAEMDCNCDKITKSKVLTSNSAKEMQKGDFKIELSWSYLQKIAAYYEFPSAIFLGDAGIFPEKKTTRISRLTEQAELLEKIKEMLDDYYGVDDYEYREN